MELRIISNQEEFYNRKDPWNHIVKKMNDASPFQTWEWNYYWWNNHKNDTELFILEAFEIKEVFGYAPLIIQNGKICFIGDVHFDYGLFLCAERKQEIFSLFMDTIERTIAEKRLTFSLRNIPTNSNQYALFRDYAKKNKKTVWRELVDTANVNLKEYDGFEGYLKAISSSLRKKAINPCRRAELQYGIMDYSDELWDQIEDIYQNRMEDRVGVSTLDWAKDTVKDLTKNDLLNISILKFENSPVAFLIFYEFKNNYYIWLTAFQKLEKFQLGHYIRYCLINRAYENDVIAIDMMRGAYDYKKQWDCNVTSNWELVYFNSLFGKIIYKCWKSIRSHIKNIIYSNRSMKNLYQKRISKI